MAGPALNTKIEILQGVDFSQTFLFFSQPASGSKDPTDLVPLSFAGASAARLMVKPSSDASATAILSLTIGGSSGLAWTSGTVVPGPAVPAYYNGIIITVTKAVSLAANGAVAIAAYYDLLVDWADGSTTCLMRGTFNLAPTCTR